MPKPRKRAKPAGSNITKRPKDIGGTKRRFREAKSMRIVLLCFVVGILLGIALANMGIGFEYDRLQLYVENFLRHFNPQDYQRAAVIKESLFKYGLLILLIWFLGFVPAGVAGALVLLLFKGTGYGFTMAFFLKSYGLRGLFQTGVLIVPQNLWMIPAYFFVCSNCLRFIFGQEGTRGDKHWDAAPMSLMEYCLVLAICLSAVVLAALYEAFVVPWIFENLI